MTCLGCQSTGFIEVIGRGDEVVGFTACPRCRPRDAALVRACEALRERFKPARFEGGRWSEGDAA